MAFSTSMSACCYLRQSLFDGYVANLHFTAHMHRCKLIQRESDLAKTKNPTPAMQAKITNLADKLRRELDRHYGHLAEAYPQLEGLGLVAKPPQHDPIWLPSRLPLAEVKELKITDFWEVESQLRIGQAHDAISDLRRALGLRSWWSHHAKAQNDGQATITKGQLSLLACQARVREASRIYSICYHWLHKMDRNLTERFGFPQLRGQDLILLNDWLEGGCYKTNEGRLPWIWTLRAPIDRVDNPPAASLHVDTSTNSASIPSSSLENIVETWRNECKLT